MTYVQRLIFAAGAALAFVGHVATAAEAVGATRQVAQASLVQIERGDQVRVEVFGDATLNSVTDVAEDGSIRLPLVGSIPVSGRSLREAAQKIEAALKAGDILLDPHVTVSVVQPFHQHVTVNGEVRAAGRYPIEPSSTVLDALALAGGINDKGSDTVLIIRKDAAGAEQRIEVQTDLRDLRDLVASRNLASSPMQAVQGGDSIFVPKATFTIIGEVAQRGEYKVERGMLLFQAIAKAGGVTAAGSDKRVEIKRRGPGPDARFVIIKGKKDMPILPDDVITVKERLW